MSKQHTPRKWKAVHTASMDREIVFIQDGDTPIASVLGEDKVDKAKRILLAVNNHDSLVVGVGIIALTIVFTFVMIVFNWVFKKY